MEKCRHIRRYCFRPPTTGEDSETYGSNLRDLCTFKKVELTLHLVPSIAAVEASLSILLEMYTRGDKLWLGIRRAVSDLIPILYVRLHQDKEAYEFIYRHTNGPFSQDEDDDSESEDEGVGHHAAIEEHHSENQRPRNLEEVYDAATPGHKVLLTLMGIKVLQYLKDIQDASIALKKEVTKLPQEMINLICEKQGAGSSAGPFGFSFNRATKEPAWRCEKISETQKLITKFLRGAARGSRSVWPSLLAVERHFTRRRFGHYEYADTLWDDTLMAEFVVTRHYQVWMETPGSFAVLRQAMDAVAATSA